MRDSQEKEGGDKHCVKNPEKSYRACASFKKGGKKEMHPRPVTPKEKVDAQKKPKNQKRKKTSVGPISLQKKKKKKKPRERKKKRGGAYMKKTSGGQASL